MRIGVPKEIKAYEYRVGLTPGAVREYVAAGHGVAVETGAGEGIGASDGRDVFTRWALGGVSDGRRGRGRRHDIRAAVSAEWNEVSDCCWRWAADVVA